jgi:hypothetical protein
MTSSWRQKPIGSFPWLFEAVFPGGTCGQAVSLTANPAAPLCPVRLQNPEGVQRAGLGADHLRAITMPGENNDHMLRALHQAGFQDLRIEPVEPTLEDVFLALAGSPLAS